MLFGCNKPAETQGLGANKKLLNGSFPRCQVFFCGGSTWVFKLVNYEKLNIVGTVP